MELRCPTVHSAADFGRSQCARAMPRSLAKDALPRTSALHLFNRIHVFFLVSLCCWS